MPRVHILIEVPARTIKILAKNDFIFKVHNLKSDVWTIIRIDFYRISCFLK